MPVHHEDEHDGHSRAIMPALSQNGSSFDRRPPIPAAGVGRILQPVGDSLVLRDDATVDESGVQSG